MKSRFGFTFVFLMLAMVHAFALNLDSASLSAGDQAIWQAYLHRSAAAAAADQLVLQRELAAQRLESALPAPDGGDFEIPKDADVSWFASEEAAALAHVIISYQTPAGGWSKHTGYRKGLRQPGMLWSSQYEPGSKPHYLGTFDNRSTVEQIRMLAGVARATSRPDCVAAAVRGFDYILASQYPNGGWPQVWPLEGGYHDAATFNDDATTNILRLLHDVAQGKPEFAFIDEAKRLTLKASFQKGLDFVIRAQIRCHGVKTGWGGQHDPLTLQPIAARAMEPAALVSVETSNLLKFLMSIPHPEPALVSCISSGLQWLGAAKVTGIARVKREGKTRYESDPNATQSLWARFYRLSDGKPIFPGRDGVIYETYAEMAAINKVGYDFYSTRPGSALGSGQTKWRKMLTSNR